MTIVTSYRSTALSAAWTCPCSNSRNDSAKGGAPADLSASAGGPSGGGGTLGNAFAGVVHEAEIVLRTGIPLFGRLELLLE